MTRWPRLLLGDSLTFLKRLDEKSQGSSPGISLRSSIQILSFVASSSGVGLGVGVAGMTGVGVGSAISKKSTPNVRHSTPFTFPLREYLDDGFNRDIYLHKLSLDLIKGLKDLQKD
uniref:Uncharacterized protein n=1 Tax=Timema tahoe TaxID=61484 RepID=A0A7R9IPE6_9NEOP|nr:unnamed protein product [Timema tahoe]